MAFITLYNHHHYLSSKHLHHPNKKPAVSVSSQSISPLPSPVNPNLLYVSVDLPITSVSSTS